MRKYTKQVLALLMALSTLVSVAMPTVFATGEGGEDNEPAESVVYQFGNAAYNDQSFTLHTAAIKDAYEAGTSNWRFESASHATQFRVLGTHEGVTENGENKYVDSNLQYYGGENEWFAVRLQSPGAGRYDLTLATGTSSSGAETNVYFLTAADVDAAVGENAASYAEAINDDPYLANGTDAFTAYQTAITGLLANAAPIMEVNFTSATQTTAAFTFEADTEYVMVVKLTIEDSKHILLNSLTATPATGEDSEGGEGGDPGQVPETPNALYDFYQGKDAGASFAEGIDSIAEMYKAGTLNWMYESFGGNLELYNAKYSDATKSMEVIAEKDWWLAMRIKAPSVDGAYDIKMTHGAGGNGATAGSIYVIPGDTAAEDIAKTMRKTGAVMTTDWFYGQATTDTIGDRVTTTGNVSLKADQEYIVVFQPTEKSTLSDSAYFWLGQLQLTRTGDYVENEDSNKDDGSILYEFYDWDHPGEYLFHTSKDNLADEIAQKYADGKLNWCHVKSNGSATFASGTPYLDVTVGETQYFCLKIKAPGTGTYEITYNHYAIKSTTAGRRGSVFIIPAAAGMEYAEIRDEANLAEPIISTTYAADQTTLQQSKGIYRSFKEGKEYYVCFSVEDTNASKKSSLTIQPFSMTMKRTGDYVAPNAGDVDDGIVYNLFQEKYANKWLTVRAADEYVMDDIAKDYDAGKSNWKFEATSGSASFTSNYLHASIAKEGKVFAIRIKAPGTGTYKLTLKHILGFEANAADVGELYIMEAPEETIDDVALPGYLAKAPVMEYTHSHNGTRFEKTSDTGTYVFQEDKEYIVMFYAADSADKANSSNSCYMYLDRLVMKRTGDYVEPENIINQGGIAAKDVIKTFSTGAQIGIANVNGHDYMAIGVYGGTMMIYDLDEWRLVDEVATNIDTPSGVTVDINGNFWVGGNSQLLYCYNPFTGEGFHTEAFLQGSSIQGMSCGEDGWLYMGTYSNGNVYRFNPETQEYMEFKKPVSWGRYVGDILQKGDYIYAAISGSNRHQLVMMDKLTGEVIKTVDITKEMSTTRYLPAMSMVSEDLFSLSTTEGLCVFKAETLERLTPEEFGINGPLSRDNSSIKDGKCYMYSKTEGLCVYDSALGKAYPLGGELSVCTALRTSSNSFVTIDDPRLPGECLVTYSGMSADGLHLYAYNLEDKTKVTLVGLIDPGFTIGQPVQTIGNNVSGTNEIVLGTTYGLPAGIYNFQLKKHIGDFPTNGQPDSFYVYKDVLYMGEYNQCCLTEVKNGDANKLFQLNDRNFDQARIHTITAGDDKIFVGTIAEAYRNGSVIAWYDQNSGLTYVVTGPDPEDVYYAEASTSTVTNQWYRVTNDELVDFTNEWDADQDGDGVYESFAGPIPLQSMNKLYYRDGLLYGVTSIQGGTSAEYLTDTSAKIFIYDVENFKMINVIDLRDHFSGFPTRIAYLPSFEGDPDISNKFWLVASETLFSMTYDRDTNKVSFTKELSFDMDSVWEGRNSQWYREIYFKGDDMFVCFDKRGGLCKINRNNPSEYVQLLSNFTHTDQIPHTFILAENGDIYYQIGDTNLYVVNVDVTEEELAEAKAVQDAIALISDTVTLADREAIFAAREAWNAMDPANQPYVNNYNKLADAEVALLRLRIADLGEVTIEDEAELESIYTTYISLKMEQRIPMDFKTISNAMSQMSIFRAQRTSDIIAALGEITLEKEQHVRDARASFMDLNIYEKRLVKNIDVLNTAEEVLTGLLLDKSKLSDVMQRIEEIGFVFFGPLKVLDARAAYDNLDDASKERVENYNTLVTAEITLIVEYVLAVVIVAFGVTLRIPSVRSKLFKKKPAKSTKE